jgi:hypothetical protein
MATDMHQDVQTATPRRSAVEARQGVISGRVILVLVTSLALVIVALSVSYWAFR